MYLPYQFIMSDRGIMMVVGLLVFSVALGVEEISATDIIFAPCGVHVCENKCRNFVGCSVAYYSPTKLWCQIFGTRSVQNTHRILVNAHPRTDPCGSCSHMSLCVPTRSGLHVCVNTSSKVGGVQRRYQTHTGTKFTGLASLAEDKQVCSLTSSSRQKVLITVPKWLRGHTVTRVNTLDLDTSEWKEIGHFMGRLLDLVVSESVAYTCQEGPEGLYMTKLEHGRWYSSKRIPLSDGKCYKVAVDAKQNVAFHVPHRGVARINLKDHRGSTLPIISNGSPSEALLALDSKNSLIYIANKGTRNLNVYTYSGGIKKFVLLKDNLRQLFVSLEDHSLYHTCNKTWTEFKIGDLPDILQHITVKGTLSLQRISAFAVTSKRLVFDVGKSLTVYCRPTFKELVSIPIASHIPPGNKYQLYSYE